MSEQPSLFNMAITEKVPLFGDVRGIKLSTDLPLSHDAARLLPVLTALYRRGMKTVRVTDLSKFCRLEDDVLAEVLAELIVARLTAIKETGEANAVMCGPVIALPDPSMVELRVMTERLTTLEDHGLNIVRPFLQPAADTDI